jgi:hypothetical protein
MATGRGGSILHCMQTAMLRQAQPFPHQRDATSIYRDNSITPGPNAISGNILFCTHFTISSTANQMRPSFVSDAISLELHNYKK